MKTLSLVSRISIVCVMCTALFFVACSDDNPVSSNPTWHWSALGDGLPGNVWAVEEYGGKLYAGGEFWVGQIDGIRVFDGRTWERVGDTTLGAGISGDVFDLTTFNNQLIVSGDFHSAGPTATNGIAAWNGNTWSALGSGLPAGMAGGEMAQYNGKLYVGNFFWLQDFRLTVWDGSAWTMIKSGGLGYVKDMCVYDGKLIVMADSSVNYGGGASVWPWIRAFDGSTWTEMSNGAISAGSLAILNDTLYICGRYNAELKAWNGSTWVSRGTATAEDDEHGGAIYQLVCHDGKLVLGGDFDRVNGTTCANIAAWDGTTYAPMTCGLSGQNDPRVQTLKTVGDRLIVGGTFTTVGTLDAPHIVEWCYR